MLGRRCSMNRDFERRVKALEVSHKEPTEYILEWFNTKIDIPPRRGVIYLKWADGK
jgi:hypothetical protein